MTDTLKPEPTAEQMEKAVANAVWLLGEGCERPQIEIPKCTLRAVLFALNSLQRKRDLIAAQINTTADALDALREAVNGCGPNYQNDGWCFTCERGTLCSSCEAKRDAVIACLIARQAA